MKLYDVQLNQVVGDANPRARFPRLVIVVLGLLITAATNCEAAFVMRIFGSGCVGENNQFVLSGATCGNVTWQVSGNWSPVSQTATSITVKWNTDNPNAYVIATFWNCSTSPSSGTA